MIEYSRKGSHKERPHVLLQLKAIYLLILSDLISHCLFVFIYYGKLKFYWKECTSKSPVANNKT